MNELVKVKNASYILYEELLMRRENLRREGVQFRVSYLKEFGSLLTDAFKLKVECIRRKKMIAWCQACVNHGRMISRAELNRAMEAEMQAYAEELKQMAEDVKSARESTAISRSDVRKIREIYYRLARLIHPDMRPELAEDAALRDYWNQIVTAYQGNHLDELEELEVLVKRYLSDHQIAASETAIPDVDQKIRRLEQEIEQILSTIPYTYRFLLEDEDRKQEKKEELQKEIAEYQQYAEELDEVLAGFDIREMYA